MVVRYQLAWVRSCVGGDEEDKTGCVVYIKAEAKY
jgi:hypothetical protein